MRASRPVGARSLSLAAILLLAGCSTPAASGTLYAENRGGPDLVFLVAGAPAISVPCDGGASLVPGQVGLPSLPWSLEVRRAADGAIVLTEEVTELPRWFVQIGDTVVGGSLNPTAVEGPAGPRCQD
ncbi:MAG: hypothetical protein ACSLFN_00280 [Candidatus Limnocylindrales bacterium]